MKQISLGLRDVNMQLGNYVDTSKTGFDMISKSIRKFQDETEKKQSSTMMVQMMLNDFNDQCANNLKS